MVKTAQQRCMDGDEALQYHGRPGSCKSVAI